MGAHVDVRPHDVPEASFNGFAGFPPPLVAANAKPLPATSVAAAHVAAITVRRARRTCPFFSFLLLGGNTAHSGGMKWSMNASPAAAGATSVAGGDSGR